MTTETSYSPLIRYSAPALVEFAENTAYRAREVQVASTNPFLVRLTGYSDIDDGDRFGGTHLLRQPDDENQDLFLAWFGDELNGFEGYITTREVLRLLADDEEQDALNGVWWKFARALFNDPDLPESREVTDLAAPTLLDGSASMVSASEVSAFQRTAESLVISWENYACALDVLGGTR